MLRVVQGDVLKAEADAVILPVDATFIPKPDQYSRLLGAIGSQFLRRYPDAELLEELEAQVTLPLALGRAAVVELSEAPFRLAILVSILNHALMLDDAGKRAVLRKAFADALHLASSANVTRLATPVLQGGWRLAPNVAFREMLATYSAATRAPDVEIYCIDAALTERLQTELSTYVGRRH